MIPQLGQPGQGRSAVTLPRRRTKLNSTDCPRGSFSSEWVENDPQTFHGISGFSFQGRTSLWRIVTFRGAAVVAHQANAICRLSPADELEQITKTRRRRWNLLRLQNDPLLLFSNRSTQIQAIWSLRFTYSPDKESLEEGKVPQRLPGERIDKTKRRAIRNPRRVQR